MAASIASLLDSDMAVYRLCETHLWQHNVYVSSDIIVYRLYETELLQHNVFKSSDIAV